MFEFTEAVQIVAQPARVWELLRDVASWWPQSNPEHESLDRLGEDGPLRLGSRLKIRERIAGIRGEAVGEISRLEPGSSVSWEAPRARYSVLGLRFRVAEGVTWRIEALGDETRVSAHVWASFPPGPRGRIIEWGFARLGGIEKDREHTRTELRYLKRVLEA